MLQLNLYEWVEKSHMSERQSVSAVPNAEPQLDLFWKFIQFFLYVSYKAHTKNKDKLSNKFVPQQLKNLKFAML